MSAPTLNIRCPSWSHLENFYERKVKDGNILLARVPFTPVNGSAITIALDLPDGLKILIPGEVEAVKQAPDGRKSAVRMVLQGLDGAMRARLQKAVADGLAAAGGTVVPAPGRTAKGTRTEDGLPLPIPADVPIDELVPLILLPKCEDVALESREQYSLLEETLTTLREKAAHDVLGVEWDADVATVRIAYFRLVKKYHPDVMARHESADISLLSSELFIYINKAYDRLRDSAVAAGKAIAAGPALLPHDGWLAEFDDLGPLASEEQLLQPIRWRQADPQSNAKADPPAATPAAAPLADPEGVAIGAATSRSLTENSLFKDARITNTNATPLHRRVAGTGEAASEDEIDVGELLAQSMMLLDNKEYDEAREVLARLLEERPRNREARALYHVAYGYTLLSREKSAEAQTQFEVALKHDPHCRHAKAARIAAPSARRRRPSLLERILRR